MPEIDDGTPKGFLTSHVWEVLAWDDVYGTGIAALAAGLEWNFLWTPLRALCRLVLPVALQGNGHPIDQHGYFIWSPRNTSDAPNNAGTLHLFVNTFGLVEEVARGAGALLRVAPRLRDFLDRIAAQQVLFHCDSEGTQSARADLWTKSVSSFASWIWNTRSMPVVCRLPASFSVGSSVAASLRVTAGSGTHNFTLSRVHSMSECGGCGRMTRWKKGKPAAAFHERPRGEALVQKAFEDQGRKVMQVRWDYDAGADVRGITFVYFRALWPEEAARLPPAENPRNSDGYTALLMEVGGQIDGQGEQACAERMEAV